MYLLLGLCPCGHISNLITARLPHPDCSWLVLWNAMGLKWSQSPERTHASLLCSTTWSRVILYHFWCCLDDLSTIDDYSKSRPTYILIRLNLIKNFYLASMDVCLLFLASSDKEVGRQVFELWANFPDLLNLGPQLWDGDLWSWQCCRQPLSGHQGEHRATTPRNQSCPLKHHQDPHGIQRIALLSIFRGSGCQDHPSFS